MFMTLMIPQSFAETGTYTLTIDRRSFDIDFSFEGDLLAIDVDKESTSLLVGISDVRNSEFEIKFPSEILSAQNDEFIVLVDGLETDYAVRHLGNETTITFPIIDDTEEIEIIGTSVIPEFPLGTLAVFGLVGTVIIALTQRHKLFKW